MNIMKYYKKFLIINVLVFSLALQTGQACTTFSLIHDGQQVFGKNYDWHLDRGLMIINKRGVLKKAMPGTQKDPGRYAVWTSKYGSLTFNQYGREMPLGGINEAGLVVELMMLVGTKYPEPDARYAIKDLQWIQYQLDNFSRVEEVISSDAQLRILTYEEPGLHFLVADNTGNCAIIEFLDGKLNLHTQDTMTVKALANNTYAESREFLKMHKGFGGQFPIAKGESSLIRFIYTAKMLKSYDPLVKKSIVDYAFDILENVSQSSTKWSIVYDQQSLRVYLRTSLNQKIRYVDLNSLNFSCAMPVKVLDITADLSGNIGNEFYEYSRQINLDLIRYAIKETSFIRNMPEQFIDQRAKYPESTHCAE